MRRPETISVSLHSGCPWTGREKSLPHYTTHLKTWLSGLSNIAIIPSLFASHKMILLARTTIRQSQKTLLQLWTHRSLAQIHQDSLAVVKSNEVKVRRDVLVLQSLDNLACEALCTNRGKLLQEEIKQVSSKALRSKNQLKNQLQA